MSTDNNASDTGFYYNPAKRQFAVAWLINAKSRDQLNLALHLQGMVHSAPNSSRSISLSAEAKALGLNSRRRLTEAKAALLKAGLLTEINTPGRPSALMLGHAVGSDRFLLLEQEHHSQVRAKDVQFPWAKARKSADLTPQKGHPLTPNEGSPHLTPQKGHPLTPNEGSPLRVLEISEKSSLRRQVAEQPSAEVDPQASGLSASSPAEISEQPEQPLAEINTPPFQVEGDPFLQQNPGLSSVGTCLEGVEPLDTDLRSLLIEAIGLEEDGTTWSLNQPCVVEGFHPVERWILLRKLAGPLPNNALDRFYAWDINCLVDQQTDVEPQKSSDPSNAANIKIKGITDCPAVIDDSHLLSTRPSNLKSGDQVLLNDHFCVVHSYDWENGRCTVIDLKTNESCCVDVDQLLLAPSSAIVETST